MNKNMFACLWWDTKGIDALRRHSNLHAVGCENIFSHETLCANMNPPAIGETRQSRQTTNRVPTKNISRLFIALFALTITLVILSCNEPEVQIIEPPGPPLIGLPDSMNVQDICFTDTLTGWMTVWNLKKVKDYEGGIFKTTNGGLTWYAKYLSKGSRMGQIQFVDKQYAWTRDGSYNLLSTTNGGETWVLSDTSIFLTEGETKYSLHGFHFINRNEGWITASRQCIYFCSGCAYIFHTTNGGAQWYLQYYTPTIGLPGLYMTTSGKGWAWGGGQFIDCGPFILFTSNNGETWVQQQPPPAASSLNISGVIAHNENYAYSYSWMGLWRTTNSGQNWDTTSIYTMRVYAMNVVSDTGVFALAGFTAYPTKNMFYSTNRGKEWKKQREFNGGFSNMFFLDESTGWLAGEESYPTGFTVYRLRSNSWIKIR